MPPPSWVAEAVVVLLPPTGTLEELSTKPGALRLPLGLLGATVVAPARTIQLPADWAQTLPAASTVAAAARNFSWVFMLDSLKLIELKPASHGQVSGHHPGNE